jgi:Trypsin-like peptidase domain
MSCVENPVKFGLITNWHCVTGRDPFTGLPRSKDGVTPDALVVCLHRDTGETGIDFLNPVRHRLPIEYRTQTGWRMHPDGQAIDIVALEIDLSKIKPPVVKGFISRLQTNHSAIAQVGADVFILGFPQDLTPTGSLPIWKRGSIATEPAGFPNGEPSFWIDSATREGMSGSPVFLRRPGVYAFDNPVVMSETRLVASDHLAFCGIYSGRMKSTDALDSQIGKVWRPECIEQVIRQGIPFDYNVRHRNTQRGAAHCSGRRVCGQRPSGGLEIPG